MAVIGLPKLGFSADQVNVKPELRDCIDAVLRQSGGLMDSVFAGLRELKNQTRGRGGAINRNPANLAAVESLLGQELAVKSRFTTELRTAFYARRPQDVAAQPGLRFDDFQFLDESEMDSNIELALTQQEVEQAVESTLPALNPLVSALMGLVTVQPQLNPIRPEAFVLALQATLEEFIPLAAARSVVLSACASLLGLALQHLYKDLVGWLRSQGIEPAQPAGSQPGASAVGGGKVVETAMSRTLLTLDKLRKLLAGDFDIALGQTVPTGKDFLHTVPASFIALEDLKLVEPMMQRLAQRARQAASQASAPGATAKVAPVDMLASDAVQHRQMGRQLGSEVVLMMLENLVDDQRLLPKVRGFLRELEPVLLRLSQSDPRFFSERQHPARQLLDKLTSRSLAFSSEHDEGFARFYKAIGNSIQVLSKTEGDAQAFVRVLRKLEAGWEREEAAQKKLQQEEAHALLNAEQRNLLAHKFAEDFQERTKDKDVPDFVKNFLRGPWAQVLAQAQLRSAAGASDPAGYANAADDLVWSVQLRLTRRNRARLVGLVPNLLVKLRQGLHEISYPPERIPVLFDALIGLHEQAFEAGANGAKLALVKGGNQVEHDAIPDAASHFGPDARLDADELDSVWNPQTPGQASTLALNGRDGSDHSGFDGQINSVLAADAEPSPWSVADLKIGSWVELFLQGLWVRAQLTWASPHATLFMFVSGVGLAHSMSRRTMDQRRAQGLIRVVSGGDVVGHALDAVAQAALRNQPPPVTGPAPLE